MADILSGQNGYTRGLPGAQGASLDQINEIVRGSTIKCVRNEKAVSPQGGECVMLELNNGDKLIFVATPGSPLGLDGPSAYIQPVLVTRRGTRLRV